VRAEGLTMRGRPWCDEEVEIVREFYPLVPTQAIADALGRSVTAIYGRAAGLGLAKSAEYLASPHAGRLDGQRGAGNRFQKGVSPWNKGTKGLIPASSTSFKPGSKPFNYMPVGSMRFSKEGYLQCKVYDTGYPPHDWVAVHLMCWEAYHGPLPPKHRVCFKDGNKQNIAIENLELLTAADLMRRNTLHNRYPKEVTLAIQLVGALKRKINAKHRRTA
jgi:hypothetical protein